MKISPIMIIGVLIMVVPVLVSRWITLPGWINVIGITLIIIGAFISLFIK